MSSFRGIAALGILLVPLFIVGIAYAAIPRTLIATAGRVSDGDTIIALFENGTKLRLRLLGIDAPEIPHGNNPGQPFGEEARDWFDFTMRSGVRSWSSVDLSFRKVRGTKSSSSFGSMNARLTPLDHHRVGIGPPGEIGRDT